MSRMMLSAALLAVVLVSTSGCGGNNNVAVSGTVTFKGQPLANAVISFVPEGSGVSAFGRTDSAGKYTLHVARGVTGVPAGEYIVQISTFTEGDADAEPPVPASKETVPAIYNSETTLKATVSASSGPIDFPLKDGKVTQPEDPEGDGA